MTSKITLTATALASILSLATTAAQATEHAQDGMMAKEAAKAEKCFGVVRAGKNDCGANAHSCAGHGTVDGDKNEWVMVPVGLCEKLVNGSLTAPAKEEPKAQ